MSYDDFFSLILSTAQVLDHNANENSQCKCKTNKATKANSSKRKNLRSIPIQPSLLILDFYQKMYGLNCHRRNALSTLRSSVTEPSPPLAKVTKSTAPELLMNPKSPTIMILPCKLVEAVMMLQLQPIRFSVWFNVAEFTLCQHS